MNSSVINPLLQGYANQMAVPQMPPVKDTSRIQFIVRKIDNGYIINCDGKEHYCQAMNDVGEKVTALLVEQHMDKP